MYLGRAVDHAPDTNRFLKLESQRVLNSSDAIWLNKTYGRYKGVATDAVTYDTITVVASNSSTNNPHGVEGLEDDDDNNEGDILGQDDESTNESRHSVAPMVQIVERPQTRSQGLVAPATVTACLPPRAQQEMQRLADFNKPSASTIVDQVRVLRSSYFSSGRERETTNIQSGREGKHTNS
jgi:hypothetical protein